MKPQTGRDFRRHEAGLSRGHQYPQSEHEGSRPRSEQWRNPRQKCEQAQWAGQPAMAGSAATPL